MNASDITQGLKFTGFGYRMWLGIVVIFVLGYLMQKYQDRIFVGLFGEPQPAQ